MVVTGNKKTHKEIPHPAEPKKKKWKSDNSASVRFLKILIIIDTSFLSRIVELDNFNNNSDYIVIVVYTWEKSIPKPIIIAMEL